MKRTPILTTLLAVGVLGCGTEAPVPDNPTYVDDVLPILKANCFHCHGAITSEKNLTSKLSIARWDIFDIEDPVWAKLGFMAQTAPFMAPSDKMPSDVPSFTGAKQEAVQFFSFVSATDPTAVMPPPPATRLSARDQQVLSNWAPPMGKLLLGKRSPNSKPHVSWLDKGKVYQVLDADGDQVLGKLSCMNGDYQIDRSGAHVLPKDAVLPCMADVYDGFDEVTANLE